MEDKELRRLNRRELLRMLIMQCEEAERLQREVDRTNARMREMEESYERLKRKLDIKDERLDQKDAKIAELKHVIEQMQEAEEEESHTTATIVPVHTGRAYLKYRQRPDIWRKLVHE